jgi:hypothetical protein
VDHIVNRLIDVAHRDPKYAIALGLQKFGLTLVRLFVFVQRTVDLDRQAIRYAHEIDDVRSDWDLAPKLVASNLPAAQPRPHAPFGLGHVVAQPACVADLGRVHLTTIAAPPIPSKVAC